MQARTAKAMGNEAPMNFLSLRVFGGEPEAVKGLPCQNKETEKKERKAIVRITRIARIETAALPLEPFRGKFHLYV